jgi:hypothetical protein
VAEGEILNNMFLLHIFIFNFHVARVIKTATVPLSSNIIISLFFYSKELSQT